MDRNFHFPSADLAHFKPQSHLASSVLKLRRLLETRWQPLPAEPLPTRTTDQTFISPSWSTLATCSPSKTHSPRMGYTCTPFINAEKYINVKLNTLGYMINRMANFKTREAQEANKIRDLCYFCRQFKHFNKNFPTY